MNKGMAPFQRRIGGRYSMLGRRAHQNIWLMTTDDRHNRDDGAKVLSSRWPWAVVQTCNGGDDEPVPHPEFTSKRAPGLAGEQAPFSTLDSARNE